MPIFILFGFQQQDRQHSQSLNKDTFCRLPVVSAQYFIGTEMYPDNCIILIYGDDDNAQGYSQIEQAFRVLTKYNILQTYISYDDFRYSNASVDVVGYNLYVFDIRYPQNFTASQPIKVEFKLDRNVPNDLSGNALVLTKKITSLSSDGQKHFDLV